MSDINILILAGLAGLATLAGVFLGGIFQKTKGNIIFSASFAASLMILISVFELIPTAAKNLDIYLLLFWVLMGVSFIWLADWIIPHLHSIKEIKNYREKSLVKVSYLVAIGLILHDFPEGFAIPSSFAYADSLGWLVVLATFIHNIPEGYILTMYQLKSGSRGFYYKSAALSMMATFSGAFLGIKLISEFQGLNPIFLSLAAGAMLFIAIHELLPESFKYHHLKTFSLGIAGAVAVYLVLMML